MPKKISTSVGNSSDTLKPLELSMGLVFQSADGMALQEHRPEHLVCDLQVRMLGEGNHRSRPGVVSL